VIVCAAGATCHPLTPASALLLTQSPLLQHLTQVDFLTYVGDALTLGQPIAAAVVGSSNAVMAIYISALELTEPLLGSQASIDDIASAVVHATYNTANASWAATGDGSAALIDAPTLSKLYAAAYKASLPAARRRSMRRLHASATTLRTAAELQPVFDAVAKVIASTNAQIQEIVVQAKLAAKEGTEFDAVKALVQMTAVAAVQQQELATAIKDLAAKVASDLNINIAAEAAKLEEVGALGGALGVNFSCYQGQSFGCLACRVGLSTSAFALLPSFTALRPHTRSSTTTPHTKTAQSFSGENLTKIIDSKVDGLPDIIDKLTDQQSELGKVQTDNASTSFWSGQWKLIVGSAVGFGGAFSLFVLALLAVRSRRRRSLVSKQERYVVGGGGERVDGAAAAGAGPVAEGATTRAAAYLHEEQPSPQQH